MDNVQSVEKTRVLRLRHVQFIMCLVSLASCVYAIFHSTTVFRGVVDFFPFHTRWMVVFHATHFSKCIHRLFFTCRSVLFHLLLSFSSYAIIVLCSV